MKNIHKGLVLLISILLITGASYAQSELSPILKNQQEQKVMPSKEKKGEIFPELSATDKEKLELMQEELGVHDMAPKTGQQTNIPQTDDLFDLQFEYPMANAGGEAGIETDGDAIYVAMWNGAGEFQKYDIDGTWLEEISVAGTTGCRDMAYNGTYFYGGAASTTIFEMDLANETLISTFTAPADCRAIAYNEDDDVFYCNNWSTDITEFDATGALISSSPVGPVGASYYGFAYQSVDLCGDGPFLWGYAQVGITLNEIVQIEVPDMVETGVFYDVGSALAVTPVTESAGGLCIHNDIEVGYHSLIGACQNLSIWGLEICESNYVPLDNDMGIQAIMSPNSGVGLGSDELVTVMVKNYGAFDQDEYDLSYTLDGGTPVVETITTTLVAGESYEHTFATTEDLSTVGAIYTFVACVDLDGDENEDNDCKTKDVENIEPFLCIDGLYTSGCDFGDGLIYWDLSDVNKPLIECDGTPYTWYHDYTDDVHLLIPGTDYTLTVQAGYTSTYVDVWVDFNDDLILDDDELLLDDAVCDEASVNYEFTISIPGDAPGGIHVLRSRTEWLSGVTGSCDTHSYGNCLDFSTQVGDQDFGEITGNVFLDGVAPYNIGDVTMVEISTGSSFVYPDVNGDYVMEIYPGTYNVSASLYGYETVIENDVVVDEGGSVTVDFTLPCVFAIVDGTVTDAGSGDPIEGAVVSADGTGVSTTTASDGTYELFVEPGNYDFKVVAAFFVTQTTNLDIVELTTTTQDFEMLTSAGTIVVIDLDPTPNPQIVPVIEGFFPDGIVEYVTTIDGYSLDETVQTVFLLLGIFANEYNLTEDDALVITAWLDGYADRNIYMEGGDTWAYDTQTTLHGKFNINGLLDGTGDLTNVDGLESFWSGFSWSYAGENSYIDHLEAIAPAINILENPDVVYYCGVAYDEGTYKTVGASFEVTGLVDGTGSFDMGIACIMGFFGYPVFTYGELEGVVTESGSGDPVEGALVDVGFGSVLTGSDGSYYLDEVLVGNWDATASKDNYHPETMAVVIIEDETTVQDFQLIAPGTLDGTVTDAASGDPIEGASIDVGGVYMTTTASDGTYEIPEVLTGDWDVYCSMTGYPTEMAAVVITEGQTTTQDFVLAAPEFSVDPMELNVVLEPNATGTEVLTLENPGLGDVEWSASLSVAGDNSDDMFDLIWATPPFGVSEAGIETDGQYIYTSIWNGAGDFLRYGMDGTYIETIVIAGAAGCRDIAYDGNYFYGGAASTTIFEMDLANATMISTFTGPAASRAIAYNHNEDAFYCNNWSDDIVKFDKSGANLGSFPAGPYGQSYYGFAYEDYSGGEYLWGYAQVGTSLNELVQIDVSSGVETGLTYDVGLAVPVVAAGIAGGLAIDDNIESGLWAFLGLIQGENMWTLELTEAQSWIAIDPTSGTVTGGGSETMDVNFDATGLLPGLYYADINFSTSPDVGSPTVTVELEVEGLIPAINLTGVYNCTDIDLSWEMPAGGAPDSWNIYRDGDLIGDATDMMYTDAMVDPEVEYIYQVTAVYGAEESFPTPDFVISAPVPEDLEPLNPDAVHVGAGDILITWEVPDACLAPDEYDVYRDGSYIGSTAELEYTDPGLTTGFYEYYVVAVYYFGESGNSAPAYVLVGIGDVSSTEFQIYPNPASDIVNVKSDYHIISVEVMNNSGQTVYSENVETTNFNVNVSQFERGIYFFRMKTEDETILRKIAVK